jgi:hypothetical protein
MELNVFLAKMLKGIGLGVRLAKELRLLALLPGHECR